jgi:hypothetical protein
MYSNLYIYNIDGIKDIILEYKKHIEWGEIINKYNNEWDIISTINLPDEFIDYFKDNINWLYRCCECKLTTSDIIKYEKYIDFDLISRYQKLDKHIIDKYENIKYYQKILFYIIKKKCFGII